MLFGSDRTRLFCLSNILNIFFILPFSYSCNHIQSAICPLGVFFRIKIGQFIISKRSQPIYRIILHLPSLSFNGHVLTLDRVNLLNNRPPEDFSPWRPGVHKPHKHGMMLLAICLDITSSPGLIDREILFLVTMRHLLTAPVCARNCEVPVRNKNRTETVWQIKPIVTNESLILHRSLDRHTR